MVGVNVTATVAAAFRASSGRSKGFDLVFPSPGPGELVDDTRSVPATDALHCNFRAKSFGKQKNHGGTTRKDHECPRKIVFPWTKQDGPHRRLRDVAARGELSQAGRITPLFDMNKGSTLYGLRRIDLEFLSQGFAVDAKNLGGFRPVSTDAVQHVANVLGLDFRQRAGQVEPL
jgi:hypothetical protein